MTKFTNPIFTKCEFRVLQNLTEIWRRRLDLEGEEIRVGQERRLFFAFDLVWI